MQFLASFVGISLKPLELRPTLLYSNMKYLIDFPMTLKCVTLNDCELPFYDEMFPASVLLDSFA